MSIQRYDKSDLRIETRDRGFVIGESLIGDTITSEANAWRLVNSDFSQMTLRRSVQVEKGVLFRPESSSLSLRTPSQDYMDGIFGKALRVFWKDTLLFQGNIRSAKLSSQAEADGDDTTYMIITATDNITYANSYVLYNYSAPEETVNDRAVTACSGTGIEMVTINCMRPLAARASTNIKLMTVLQEASDAQVARFYSDRAGRLVMNGLRPGEPTITFSDQPSIVGTSRYRTVNMDENLNNTITGVVAQAKQDETLALYKKDDSAVVTHEEVYEIDLPLAPENYSAWLDSFPLRGYTSMEPSSLSTYWQDELIDLDLTDLVAIQWKGRSYRAGVAGLTYDIRPDRDYGLKWNVNIDLMPGHLIEFSSVVAPSPVRNFKAIATDPHTVDITWERPVLPAEMTGYMLRYADGPQPPVSQNDGMLLGVFPLGTTSFTLTNQPSRDLNSYAIWAVTDNPNVYSGIVTTNAITPEVIPSAVTNLTAVKGHNAYQQGYVTQMWHQISWENPVTMGDAASWLIRYTTDGTEPTPTTNGTTQGLWGITGSKTVKLTYSLANLNKTIRIAVFVKTINGQYSPGAYLTVNSNETIPGPVSSTLENISMPGYSPRLVRVRWTPTNESNPDFFVYRIEYNVNQPGPVTVPGTGTLIGEFTRESAAQAGYTYDAWVAINSNVKFTIFAKTNGGKYGYGWNSIQTPA